MLWRSEMGAMGMSIGVSFNKTVIHGDLIPQVVFFLAAMVAAVE
jgi:hypothetical protein